MQQALEFLKYQKNIMKSIKIQKDYAAILFYVVTAPITYIVPNIMRSEVNFTVNHSEEYVADPAGVDNYIIDAINLRGLEDFDKDVTFCLICSNGIFRIKIRATKVKSIFSIRDSTSNKVKIKGPIVKPTVLEDIS